MSDFDFEEIDRAVSGALNSRASASSEGEDRSAASMAEAGRASQEPTRAPAMRRGAGRFMDVVHPSSDMRSGTPNVRNESTRSASLANPESKEEPSNVTTSQGDDESTDNEPQISPLQSPFLPDAKVEKRPLGGDASTLPSGPSLGGQNFEADFSAQPEDPLLSAPEEDLMLEAPDDLRIEAEVMPDPIDFESQSVSIEDKEDTEAAKLFHNEPTPTPEYTGSTSIAQQYADKPVTQQDSGAIYDTESYHQPVVAPAKKHSGAWVFFWIILLIILGAGAGVAVYFFVLPML